MSRKFVIACGGTGGHLAPGIALAQKLSASGYHCFLFISKKEVDSRLIEKYPELDYTPVPGVPFSLNPIRLLSFAYTLAGNFFYSFEWLRKERPDLVVAFGGFISVGVVLAAFILRVPIVLHEANRKPGRTVCMMRKLARRIYLPDGIRLRGVNASRVRYYGYPVRREVYRHETKEARKAIRFTQKGKLLVILGGSQGASVFNQWVVEHFEELAECGINIHCVTGPLQGTDGIIEGSSSSGENVQAVFQSFSNQVPELLSAADLVVSRAGAGAIAEIIQCRAPSILIPYPYAADNHQLANALFFERQGGGVLLHQEKMDSLSDEIKDLILNDWLLTRLRHNLQKMDRFNSVELIQGDLLELSGEKSEPDWVGTGNVA